MADYNGEDGVAEGPLFLLWYTAEAGGRSIYAQWNGYTFDLYGDAERKDWLGEAETVDDPDDLALDLFWVIGRGVGTVGRPGGA